MIEPQNESKASQDCADRARGIEIVQGLVRRFCAAS